MDVSSACVTRAGQQTAGQAKFVKSQKRPVVQMWVCSVLISESAAGLEAGKQLLDTKRIKHDKKSKSDVKMYTCEAANRNLHDSKINSPPFQSV